MIATGCAQLMDARKTVRFLGISLALLALLAFSTVVVSDFDCHSSADDARCPYCHLTHQAPPALELTQCVSVLEPIAFLPFPEDTTPVIGPIFAQTAPRAPPF
jgi:hypothetical protein